MNGERTLKLLRSNSNILIIVGIIFSLGLFSYVVFINIPSLPFFQKLVQTPKKFSKLDKSLNTFVNSQDTTTAVETAEKDNLAVSPEGKITVIITVKDDSFVLTPKQGIEQHRYGRYIQAILTTSQLKTLAKNPKIESIAAPQKATKQPPASAVIVTSAPVPSSSVQKNTSPQPTR